MKKVPVYEHDQDQDGKGAIIGRVTYNDRLDRWDGNNYGNGGTGMHKGISRLTKSGRMVIIIGTQWQGCLDYAYVTTMHCRRYSTRASWMCLTITHISKPYTMRWSQTTNKIPARVVPVNPAAPSGGGTGIPAITIHEEVLCRFLTSTSLPDTPTAPPTRLRRRFWPILTRRRLRAWVGTR